MSDISRHDRSPEQVRNGWGDFASVTDPSPGRFEDVADAEGVVDDAPVSEISEAAAGLPADHASLAAIARWFDVPESQLLQVISEATEEEAPAPSTVAEPAPEPAAPEARSAPRRSTPSGGNLGAAGGPRQRARSSSPIGFRESLQLLRRRLLVVILGFILGVSAGWLTAPGEARSVTTFRATHTLIYDPQGGQTYNIEQIALLATSGEVPSRVAARLKLDRAQVRGAVSAEAKTEVFTISITATSHDAAGAVSLADVTAEELATAIESGARSSYQAELDRLTAQVDSARARLNAVPPKNAAALGQAQSGLDNAELALAQYKATQAPKAQLRTLEAATASPVSSAGVRAPKSKPVRAALLGGLGALLAVAGAFALDRLDTRIRSKATAEEAFGVPVVAEVPSAKSGRGELLVRTQPSSAFVEAYRGLRTYVALWAPEGDRDDGHRVIVVTSPAAGEGKTTTVAHLAALLAEIGRSVVVVSADLRRPRLHEYFDVPVAPGLVDALRTKSGLPVFAGLDQPTPVRGVRVIPSGPAVENPAPLFEHAGRLVASVRGLAEFVLIDAPPLLVANDAVEMARYADGVLLVARAGQTPIEAAERSAETLERLEIPVVGTVLVGSDAASSASRYYASRYYAEPERGRRSLRRPVDGNPPGDEAASRASQDAPPTVSDS